jgi:hypothetical protein
MRSTARHFVDSRIGNTHHRAAIAILCAVAALFGCDGGAGPDRSDSGMRTSDSSVRTTDSGTPILGAMDADVRDAGSATTPLDAHIPDGGAPVRLPNERLRDLPDNTALDLGLYECEERVPDLGCTSITDYSRLNYDPYMHRVLMFGGGHAATGRTDVDVLDLATLTWSSLYPSMTCAQIMIGDIDPRGFHRATGHPVARHTYDQNVIAEVGGIGRLVMLSTEGFSGVCHPYESPIRSVAYLPLGPGETTWSYSDEFSPPWGYATAAEFDPESGMIIVIGAGGMHVLDPASNTVVAFVETVAYRGYQNNLVYFPPNGRMYLIERNTESGSGGSNIVWEVVLDRNDWSRTTSTVLESSGPAPSGTPAFAYDARNRVIGGGVATAAGAFHVFDPVAREWHASRMNVISETGATPTAFYADQVLDYDPIDNVYIFISPPAPGTASGRRTWAYRYRN